MALRLRVYNAVLHLDYKLPVISLVIYPFRTKMAQSPLKVHVGPHQIVDFLFFTLALFEQDAERYVREHITCMYPLLPTMKGANHALIKQATDELVALYREDEVTLSQQIVWLELFLERTDTIPPLEKSEIQEHLKVYDLLWLENPKVQQIRADGKREGQAEGVEVLQRTLINFINVRFPALSELAHQKVPHIKKLSVLEQLTNQMYIAPDTHIAHFLLASIEDK
jgi:hypothetical protein